MNITDTLRQYIYKYYISGFINDSSYNPVDTVTYALLLGISVFGVLKLLEKLKVEINTRFIASVTPYVLAGSSLRVLEDSNVFTPPLQYLFITPIIYFFMFAVTVLILVFFVLLERKQKIKDYYLFFGLTGVAWTAFNVLVLLVAEDIRNPGPAIMIPALASFITYVVYLVFKKLDFTLFTSKLNISILFAHVLDASSTFVGMDFLGYYEKHVVPTFFINLAGNVTDHPSFVMIPLKLLIFIPVLYILDNKFDIEKEGKLIALMKLTILVLGLSPAIRNTLRILMGV